MADVLLEVRSRLLGVLDVLAPIAHACERATHANELRVDVQQLVLSIGVTGTRSAGKSTLINAIVARPNLLPASQLTTTTCAIEVQVGHAGVRRESVELTLETPESWMRRMIDNHASAYSDSGGRSSGRGKIAGLGFLGARSSTSEAFDDAAARGKDQFQLFCDKGAAALRQWRAKGTGDIVQIAGLKSSDSRWSQLQRGLVPWEPRHVDDVGKDSSTLPPLPPESVRKMVISVRGAPDLPPMTLVDMPGYGDLDSERDRIAHESLERTDVHLLLFPADQGLNAGDRSAHEELVGGHHPDRCLFVATKADLVAGDLEQRFENLGASYVHKLDRTAKRDGRFAMVSAQWRLLSLATDDLARAHYGSSIALERVWNSLQAAGEVSVSLDTAMRNPRDHEFVICGVLERISGVEELTARIEDVAARNGHLVRSVTDLTERVRVFAHELEDAVRRKLEHAERARIALAGAERERDEFRQQLVQALAAGKDLVAALNHRIESGEHRLRVDRAARHRRMRSELVGVGLQAFRQQRDTRGRRRRAGVVQSLTATFLDEHAADAEAVESLLSQAREDLESASRKFGAADVESVEGKVALSVVDRRPPILDLRDLDLDSPLGFVQRIIGGSEVRNADRTAREEFAHDAILACASGLADQSMLALEAAATAYAASARGVVNRCVAANRKASAAAIDRLSAIKRSEDAHAQLEKNEHDINMLTKMAALLEEVQAGGAWRSDGRIIH